MSSDEHENYDLILILKNSLIVTIYINPETLGIGFLYCV